MCSIFGVTSRQIPGDILRMCYADKEFLEEASKYDYCRPITKESLLRRELFGQSYPGQARMFIDFRMPNKTWRGCGADDPSARVLANYGASGV